MILSGKGLGSMSHLPTIGDGNSFWERKGGGTNDPKTICSLNFFE